MADEKKRLVVFDGNAIVHRAFHALPPLTTKKGELVNAIYGFLLVFLRVIREFKPEFIVAAFDFPAPSFRHKQYELYKAKRKKAPDELYQQIPKIKEILEKLGIKVLEKEGYEADDILGTIARAAEKEKSSEPIETILVSGDLDSLQAVNANTKVYALRKGVKDIILYDEKAVQEKYEGLLPNQLPDFKALRGDPSDNIPGVFGIGEKTAITLLREFGSAENIYKALEKDSSVAKKIKPLLRKKLLDYKNQAFLSKDLGTLRYDVPLDFELEQSRWQKLNQEKIIQALSGYEFATLISRFSGMNGAQQGVKPKPIAEKKPKDNKSENTVKNNLKLW